MPLSMLALAVARKTMRQPSSLKERLSPMLVAKKPPAMAPDKHEMSMLTVSLQRVMILW